MLRARPVPRPAPPARLSDASLPAQDHDDGPWAGRHVNVGGADVFVRTTPAGSPDVEPALFVHGLGGASTNWTDFAGVLRHRLATQAIDLPGHGRSGPAPARDYTLRAHARTVVTYLEQSGRGPVHLVGNSMGGAVSIVVAAQRPDLVRTLTLISPAVPDIRVRAHPLRTDPRMALLVVPGLGGVALRQAGRIAVEHRVRATLALCFADPGRFPERRRAEAVDEANARAAMPWANEAFLRSLRGLIRSQFTQGRRAWTAMAAIAAPTLVLWGDTDRLVPADLAPHVAAAIPAARLLVLEDIGHTAMMEDPVTSARALLGLLEDTAKETAKDTAKHATVDARADA